MKSVLKIVISKIIAIASLIYAPSKHINGMALNISTTISTISHLTKEKFSCVCGIDYVFLHCFKTLIYNEHLRMLKKILSISGKPGLYKLVSTSKTITLVESLIDKKRIPTYSQEKIVSLGEIAIYTTEDEIPLKEVFTKIKEKENGEKIADENKSNNNKLFSYFETILPTYDKEKVYASDIKKIVNWYNLLIENNIDFEAEEPLLDSDDDKKDESTEEPTEKNTEE